MQNKVTLLFGRICSGKSTYSWNGYRVVVSNIVKGIIKSSSRAQLQQSMHLDDQIASSILHVTSWVLCETGQPVLIDGIRQVSIVEKVLEKYPDAELVWLEVPTEERKRRYENRKDAKDVEPFEAADNKPIELECQKIFTTFQDKLTIINNYGIN